MKHSERHLPKQVDAFKLTQQGIVLEGLVSIRDLPRLLQSVNVSSESLADLHPVLQFGVDDEGHRTVEGQVHAVLPMTCQRCLQLMPYEVQADIHWAFVATDEAAKQLPSHLDPVMLPASGYVDVYEMLEDELLLSLPITVFHNDCENAGATKTFGEVEWDDSSAKEKPFVALADLFKDGNLKKGR
jgi:uncharacterized protein